MHKQVFAKVNILVDEGIKELIETLSLFPELETFSCCEELKSGDTWVYFRFGRTWQKLCEFIFNKLAPCLKKDIGKDVKITIEYPFDEFDMLYESANLFFPKRKMRNVIKSIKALYKEYY